MFCFAQVGIALPESSCEITRQFDQRCVAQISHVQFRHPALAHAEEVAGTAYLRAFLLPRLSISEMSSDNGINHLLERFVITLRARYERYARVKGNTSEYSGHTG